MPTTYQEFLKLLLADIAKAPVLLADAVAVKAAVEKTLTDAGLPIPWAGAAVAVPHEASELESQVIAAHKLGDGTLLKGLGAFLNSPLGQTLLQLLLGSIGKPAA